MKVLHLIGGSLTGGAALAALELHSALADLDIDSNVIHSHGRSNDAKMTSLENSGSNKFLRFARTTMDRAIGQVLRNGGDGRNFSPGLMGAPVMRFAKQADILHIHWINDGSFRLPKFAALPLHTVWTFHDMWPVSGGCHYAFDCREFEGGCKKCPALGVLDVASSLQKLKARAVRSKVSGVAVSSWLAGEASRSSVFKDQNVAVIPNLVDIEEFWPVPQDIARAALGLENKRPILLTGHASSSYQKGSDLLADALKNLRERGVEFDLIGFGGADAELTSAYSKHYGRVNDTTTLRLLYSAADAFAFPSRTEAFGRTIIEAFACGTPVACFADSGPDDIVTENETGKFAPAGNVAAFATALQYCLENSERLAKACRARAENVYAKPVVAAQYVKLYNEILARISPPIS